MQLAKRRARLGAGQSAATRRLRWFLSLSWIVAVLLQVTLPVLAAQSVARVTADPFADAPICSAHEQGQDQTRQHERSALCVLCQAHCLGTLPALLSGTHALAPPRLVTEPRAARGWPRMPRGPPGKRANARGPPTST